MNKKAPIIVLIFFLLAIYILGNSVVYLYTDWLWFKSLNYSVLFSRVINTQALLGLVLGVVSGVLFYLNGLLSMRWGGLTAVEPGQYFQFSVLDRISSGMPKYLKTAALLVALVMGLYGSGQWEDFLTYFHAVPFGQSDPVFGNDLGFYVFKLPFMEFVLGWLFRLLFLLFLESVLILVLRLQILVSQDGVSFRSPARRYFILFGSLFFFLIAAYFALSRYDSLFESRGVVFGAGYADIHGLLPALNLMVLISFLTGVVLAFNLYWYRIKAVYAALVVFTGCYLLGVVIYPAALQRFVVLPNEVGKETAYLSRHINSTRTGYGIQNAEERNLTAAASLDRDVLARNDLTIKNIRLWDHKPLLETYGQIQEIRTYYKFLSVDNDRYYLNGEYRQVMLSPRELAYEDLPSRVWINEHLTYTHGYGLTLGVVNHVTPEGLPALLIQDIPPVSKTSLRIDRPEIYFGEVDNEYVFVDTKVKEFDYPLGEQNVFSNYKGKSGVRINSMLDKLLWSVRFNSLKILLSSDVAPGCRIIFNRAVFGRVQKMVPFLKMDKDPYMVISGGRLYWLLDGYTASYLYPYSKPTRGVGGYIRNSVLAVVDAYEGTVELFVKDAKDPLIQTYARIFPGVFKPLASLNPDLLKHMRYPHWLFRIQTNIYDAYHMTRPQSFYNKEDLWEIPSSLAADVPMEPYYTIMRLPGEKKEEFILMTPFTPAKKDNLAAWMCAKCDPDDFGKLVVYRFPKQKLIYGPRQIESRINQDPEISRQLSLWDQRGSRVILGTLLVIPIEESLIYVQPLYIKAESGQIPELKRVLVVYENSIAMEETLEQSLAKLFGGRIAKEESRLAETVAETPGLRNLVDQAWSHFQSARRFLKEENWAAYGQELKKLEATLEKLRREEKKGSR